MDEKDKKDFIEFLSKTHKKTLELAKLLDTNGFSFKESIYSCIAMACLDSMDVGFSKQELHDLLDEVYKNLDANKKNLNVLN